MSIKRPLIENYFAFNLNFFYEEILMMSAEQRHFSIERASMLAYYKIVQMGIAFLILERSMASMRTYLES